MLTAPQILYLGKEMPGKTVNFNKAGRCRICGGFSFGEKKFSELDNISNWTFEDLIKCPDSDMVCEACQKTRNHRNTSTNKVGHGFIATTKFYQVFSDANDALNFTLNMPNDQRLNEPYVLCYMPKADNKPVTFMLPVSYPGDVVNSMVVFSDSRKVYFPGNPKLLKEPAKEIYSVTFNIHEAINIIEFLLKNVDEKECTIKELPEFKETCFYDPLWGLCLWMTGKSKYVYRYIFQNQSKREDI